MKTAVFLCKDWANFVFWVIFSKIFKHQVQSICGQVYWLKKSMLAYGKHMPRNNQFSVFSPRKNIIFPRKIICPNFWKIYPKKQNLPSHLVQPIKTCFRPYAKIIHSGLLHNKGNSDLLDAVQALNSRWTWIWWIYLEYVWNKQKYTST